MTGLGASHQGCVAVWLCGGLSELLGALGTLVVALSHTVRCEMPGSW